MSDPFIAFAKEKFGDFTCNTKPGQYPARNMRLVGDIGGTKASLGLVDDTGPEPVFLAREKLSCKKYDSFSSLLADFLSIKNVGGSEISGGCLAVAGPISDDGCRAYLTNLPWMIDVGGLSHECGIGQVTLINDFAAAALGTIAITAEDMTVLQEGAPTDDGIRLIVGAGTGLGMAVLVPQGSGWRVLPGEGGHTGFAPTDDVQIGLLAYLQRSHGRVGYEHIVSGPGLVETYKFVANRDADPWLLASPDPAAAITMQAAVQPVGPAQRAVDLFLAVFGAFAGDMALALMARGGVFIAGGIAAQILHLMQAGTFMNAFNVKDKHGELARRIPVYVVTDPDFGIKGALASDRQSWLSLPRLSQRR